MTNLTRDRIRRHSETVVTVAVTEEETVNISASVQKAVS